MYYISDPHPTRIIENKVQKSQKNEAHFIELFGALALTHFMSLEDSDIENKQYFEYSVRHEADKMSFDNVSDEPEEGQVRFKSQISQMAYLYKYFFPLFSKSKSSHLTLYKGQSWAENHEGISSVLNSSFFQKDFLEFLKLFHNWLKELGKGNRSFSPLDLEVNDREMGKFVIGNFQKDFGGFLNRSNPLSYQNFNTILNKKDISKRDDSPNEYFMRLMKAGTEELFQKIFKK